MATPERIKEVTDLFAIQYPAPAGPQRNDPGSAISSWLDRGAKPQAIVDALVFAMQALRSQPDPGPGPTEGQWTGARYKAFAGHFNVQDVLGPRVFGNKNKPTAQELYDRVFGDAATAKPPTSSAPPVVPPAIPDPPFTIPSTGPVTREEFIQLKNLVMQNHDARILALERRFPLVDDPTKPGPGR